MSIAVSHDPVVFTIFVIFTGAAILATVALYARQALLVAYIVLGIFLGPSGFAWVSDPTVIKQISNVGIMFLLFLLGLNLPPAKLVPLFRETTLVTGISSVLFAVFGVGIGAAFGFNLMECIIVGAAVTFSSTIIGLKLLPTTVLHHKRTGEIIISILLMQDIFAVIVLLLIQTVGQQGLPWLEIALRMATLPTLFAFVFIVQRYLLIKLIARFDKIQEYMFLMTIAWCLGIAELSSYLGLSHEVGAFMAGVALATNPISLYIGENLKPLRDFFLILFFFSLGASFDLNFLQGVLWPAVLIATTVLFGKPVVFKILLHKSGETMARSGEIGARLGQISEFSILIAVLAMDLHIIGARASYLIQVATLLSFILSSYFIVLRYPTPIALSDKLRRD